MFYDILYVIQRVYTKGSSEHLVKGKITTLGLALFGIRSRTTIDKMK